MKIIVESLSGAHDFINNKRHNLNDKFAVITVTQSRVYFDYSDNIIDHLIIPVGDIDEAIPKDVLDRYPDEVMFDSAFAKEIKVFVELNKDKVDFFLIHCDAGVSRSRAVAAALSFVFNGDDMEHFKKGIPNPTIYKMLLAEYGFSNGYKDLHEKKPCWVCGKNWDLESGLWNSHLGTDRNWHLECDDDYKLLIQEEKYMKVAIKD